MDEDMDETENIEIATLPVNDESLFSWSDDENEQNFLKLPTSNAATTTKHTKEKITLAVNGTVAKNYNLYC